MRSYELMTIHRPEMAETDVRARVTEIETALRARGAEIDETEFWGKRRFAYEIAHLREGYYSVVSFHSDPDPIPDIDRALSLSDQVIRHKFIRTDGKPARAPATRGATTPPVTPAAATRVAAAPEAAAPEAAAPEAAAPVAAAGEGGSEETEAGT